MDPLLILGIALIILLLLLATETPVAWALAISGSVGIALIRDWTNVVSLLADSPLFRVSVYALVVIPMYMLLGNLALNGRLAEQVFAVAQKVSGQRKSALGVSTILACGAFSAVSGSSVATAAIMAKIAIPPMVRAGYRPHHASGIVAAGGTLGILIPPSVILVIYGLVTEESITQLLAAGIIPGIISVIAYAIFVVLWVAPRVDPPLDGVSSFDQGPSGKKASQPTKNSGSAKETTAPRVYAKTPYRGVVRAGIIFALVFAGIYFGWMTVSESAALAAVAALVFLVMELRREGRKVIGSAISESLKETAATTSMVFSIVIGSAIFSFFVVLTGLPRVFSDWVSTLDIPPLVVVVILLLILIPMGMALDSLAIIVIAMPFMHPIITDLGFSGIWFGILAVKLIEIGLMTPPVGLNVFVVAGAAREHVRTEQVFRGVLGFIMVDLIVVTFLLLFPEIVLFLPNALSG
jgi:tripartite ATP-independent transporter DctM subunit